MQNMRITREKQVNGKGTLLAYANHKVIIGESQKKIEENTKKLIISSKRISLIVNENKTKYTIISRHTRIMQNITMGQNTFDQVENFK